MCVYMHVHTHIDTWYTLLLLVLEYGVPLQQLYYSNCTAVLVLQLYYSSSLQR
jgi:hypothetical protein